MISSHFVVGICILLSFKYLGKHYQNRFIFDMSPLCIPIHVSNATLVTWPKARSCDLVKYSKSNINPSNIQLEVNCGPQNSTECNSVVICVVGNSSEAPTCKRPITSLERGHVTCCGFSRTHRKSMRRWDGCSFCSRN